MGLITIKRMPAPEPMLSTAARSWPTGGDWVLQPKWDGFRCLVESGSDHRVRGWSRHGTSLGDSMASVLAECGSLPRGTILDGELIALSEKDGRPVQDFAAVRRAVFTADIASQRMLRYVAFDVLKVEDQDLRGHGWQERDALLRQIVHDSESIRPIATLPASEAAHAAIVRLGFEGSVLKRPTSLYRSGRHASWRKLKARYTTTVMLRAVHHARDGQLFAVCELDGRRVTAVAGTSTQELIGQPIQLAYSRVDADGTLRAARVAATNPDPLNRMQLDADRDDHEPRDAPS